MSQQKYYYKGRDMIKIRNFVFNLFITLIFSLVGILSFFVTPGFSLSWKDDEWTKSGCPKAVSGNWTADNPANTNLKLLSINNNKVIYTSQNDQTQQFAIIKSSFILENQYLEMKLKPINNDEELVIKIRPHLVHEDPKDHGKASSCLIKVFSFKNEKHAKTDKYFRWNIYRLIN